MYRFPIKANLCNYLQHSLSLQDALLVFCGVLYASLLLLLEVAVRHSHHLPENRYRYISNIDPHSPSVRTAATKAIRIKEYKRRGNKESDPLGIQTRNL